MDFAKLMARVQHLLMSPATEWDAIAGEPADVQAIYMNYVGPLVVAAGVAIAIGVSVVGVSVPIVGTFRFGVSAALTQMIIYIVLNLAMVYGLAFAINAFAPQFGATPDMGQAFKLAAYSPTAWWVASLVMIIPSLGILAVLGGFYSLYLLYVGLPTLMKPAADKATTYTLVIVGVMIAIAVIVSVLQSNMMPAMTPMMRTY